MLPFIISTSGLFWGVQEKEKDPSQVNNLKTKSVHQAFEYPTHFAYRREFFCCWKRGDIMVFKGKKIAPYHFY